jgi:hypothetical protein
MPHYPSNVLLHDSIFSGNYDHPHDHPHAHLTSTPLNHPHAQLTSTPPNPSSKFLFTMNPLDPAVSHYPPPAPQLVLSRPGSQQYSPTDEARYSHYQLHPHASAYRNPSTPTNIEHDARFSHYQLHPHASAYRKPSTSHTYPDGHESNLSPISPGGQQWNPKLYYQPPYVPPAPYNYPVQPPLSGNPGNPVYQRPRAAASVHESIGLYGVYVQPEGHAGHASSHMRGQAGQAGQASRPVFSQHIIQDDTAESLLSVASTPVLYRMSAKRLPGDQSYIPAPQLASCLQKDLEGNRFTIFPNFFLDNVWPDSALPFPLEMDLFNQLTLNKIWDDKNDCFITPPIFTEHNMAEWLNALGGMIGAFSAHIAGFERKRSWSAGNCGKQPDGASINRKPDLVLVDRSFVDKRPGNTPDDTPHPHISWTHIHALAEVTRSYPLPKRITSTINDKTYLLFICQHDRRFVPALSFNGQAEFSLTLTDRQGQLCSPFISFLHGKANAFLFMKILAFLMYGHLHNTGRDTTMELNSDGRVKAIYVNGHRYEVVYLIYSLQSMIGRGTTIWLVIRDNKHYILKDSWIQISRVGSEIKFLEMLKDDVMLHGHVPHIVEGEDVSIDGSLDSTGRYRIYVGGLHDARTHRRLVMSPIGNQITTFQSIVEFISALIDIVGGKLSDIFSFLSNIVNISS